MTAPGFAFGPSDEVAVRYYLIPRLLGRPVLVQIQGVIIDDDPLSAPPWELLERNGRKDEAFFFAEGQARDGKGSRQKRTCAGGGWWEGQKTSAEGDKMPVPDGSGREAAWRKKVFNFHGGGGDGKKGSMGWVMHEYAVTAPEDLAQSRLRLYRVRTSSHARKLSLAIEVPPALGFAPGFLFAPEDDDLIAHYLLPGMLGKPLPVDGLIIGDDPLSVPPWELLKRNGCKNDAFFFALGQAKSSSKSARQKRTCVGGGFWNGEKTCIDGQKVHVPVLGGSDVAWRKKAFSFQEAGNKGSTGWVMHEYVITAPDHLAEKRLRLYRIRFSGHGKKRKRGDGDSSADEEAHAVAWHRVTDDALLDMPLSPQPICSSAVLEGNSDGRDCIDGDQDAASVTAPDKHGLTPFTNDNGEIDVDAALDYFMEIAAHQDPDIRDIIFCTKVLAQTPPYSSVGANLVASPTQGDALLDMPSSQQPICSSAVLGDKSNGRDCIDGDQDAATVTAPDEHGLTPFTDDNGEIDVNAALDYFMEIGAHQDPDIRDIIFWTKVLAPTPPYSSAGASLVASPPQGINFWMPRSCLNSAYRCLRDRPSSTWLNTPRLTMVE
ncbi:hypothetical protein BS78_02G078400 [Paspalum vaginatum]|nr:hypothetical protein BS78_02G078400 [Paspalum vaginatum]